jgi:Cys-tRNA synthase (O-phospho-L-seryl-tRNA:Cys-tRNA synthase)
VYKEDVTNFEKVIAESVADVLLNGLYEHSGCSVTLTEVRYDDVGGSGAAFMKAANSALEVLLSAEWKMITRAHV